MERLIEPYVNADGEKRYKMTTFNIVVTAQYSGGIAPIFTYLLDDEDVTDAIRQLRFHPNDPKTFIDDFPQFQTMLFEKEQQALNNLYDQFSIRPKNMNTSRQVVWTFFITLIIAIPFFVLLLLR